MNMSENKSYTLSEDQYNILCRLIYRIEGYKESIQELCLNEKPNIFYGFKLGEIHENVSDIYVDLENLIDEVKKTRSI